MFAELSKSFAKTFLVGHLLPAILFLIFAKLCFAVADGTTFRAFFENLKKVDDLVDVTLFGLFLALLLATINRELIRVYEGYSLGKLFGFRFWIPWALVNERLRHKELTDGLASAGKKLGILQYAIAKSLPERANQVLATRFGNTIRAFERYSNVSYGFEAVEGTNRLTPLMDESVRDAISWAKSKVDFWVNLSFLSLFGPLVWWLAMPAMECREIAVAIAIALAASVLAIHLARQAAYEWGVNIKSGIDLTLPKLATTLGYAVPVDADEQRKFWKALSQHFLLRSDQSLGLLQPYRHVDPPKPRPKKTAKARMFPRKRAKP